MTSARRTSPRAPAAMKHREHQRLWRMVEGAVLDAFQSHPDYLTPKGRVSAIQSITKRVVGQLVGHAKQAQERGRPKHAVGGSGRGAEIPGTTGGIVARGAANGAGRHFLPSSRTRWPAFHDALCGNGVAQ